MDYDEMSEEEFGELVEAGVARGLANPMPRDLNEQVKDVIEPQTINGGIKHGDVMDCIHVAWPVILDYLREHPELLAE
jgi:hypothetical protein